MWKRRRRGTKRGKRPGRRWIGLGVALAPLLLLTLAVPYLWIVLDEERVEALIRRELAKGLAVPYKVDAISFGIFSGLTIHGLTLGAPPGCEYGSALEIRNVHIEFNLLGLLTNGLAVQEVEVEGGLVHLERGADGTLNLLGLAAPGGDSALQIPAVHIRNVDLVVCPRTLTPLVEAPLTISSLSVNGDRNEAGELELIGSIGHPEVRNIHAKAYWNPEEGTFRSELVLRRFKIDDQRSDRIPAEWQELFGEIRPRGELNLTLNLGFSADQGTSWSLDVDLREASLQPRMLPIRMESLSGQARITPGQITITRPFTGLVGRGNAVVAGSVTIEGDGIGTSNLEVVFDQLPVGPEVFRALGDAERQLLESLAPTGQLGVIYSGQGPGFPPPGATLDVVLKGVTVTPQVFPYQIENLTGTIRYHDQTIEFLDIHGGSAETPVTLTGSADLEGFMDVTVTVDKAPLDREVEAALPVHYRPLWRDYRPGGTGRVEVVLKKDRGEPGPVVTTTVDLLDASLTHYLFPYSLEHVTGRIEILGRETRCTNVRGRHNETEVILEKGLLGYGPDGVTNLHFQVHAPRLEIGDDLIQALPASTREMVRAFDPRGHLDTTFDLRRDPGQKLTSSVTAFVVPPCRVSHVDFPYGVTLDGGGVEIDLQSGVIKLADLSSDPDAGPVIKLAGEHRPGPGGTPSLLDVTLSIAPGTTSPGLEVGKKLVTALPLELRRFVEELRIQGATTGTVAAQYRYETDVEGQHYPLAIAYQGTDVGITNTAIQFGVGLDEVNASLNFEGRASRDESHSFEGVAHVSSLRMSRFRVRDSEWEVYYGRPHRVIRSALAGVMLPPPGGQYRLGDPFTGRLRNTKNTVNAIQLYVKKGNLYGGNVEGFGYVDVGVAQDFHGELVTYDVDIAGGSEDIFGKKGLAGTASGRVFFGGNDDAKSFYGGGRAYVRNGKLASLPAIVKIIDFLSLSFASFTRPTYIKHLSIPEFRIDTDRFVVDKDKRMVFDADRSKILVWGSMDFDQIVDMTVDPEFFTTPKWLPLEYVDIFQMSLKGPVDNPKVSLPFQNPFSTK